MFTVKLLLVFFLSDFHKVRTQIGNLFDKIKININSAYTVVALHVHVIIEALAVEYLQTDRQFNHLFVRLMNKSCRLKDKIIKIDPLIRF